MWNKLINLYCRQTPEQAVEPVQTEDMDVSKYCTFVAVHCFAGFYPQFVKAPSGAKMHVIDIDKFMLQANTYAAYWTSANWRYGYFQVFYIYTFTLSCWRLNKICKGHISGRYPSNVIQKKFMLKANTWAGFWTSAIWRYGWFQVLYIHAFTLSCLLLFTIFKDHINGRHSW